MLSFCTRVKFCCVIKDVCELSILNLYKIGPNILNTLFVECFAMLDLFCLKPCYIIWESVDLKVNGMFFAVHSEFNEAAICVFGILRINIVTKYENFRLPFHCIVMQLSSHFSPLKLLFSTLF